MRALSTTQRYCRVEINEGGKGAYQMIHQPTGGGLGGLQMWLASSMDLLHWGADRPLMAKRPGMWDSVRVGAGAVPIKTPAGWLAIYHGVNAEQGYCLGAVLLDLDDPSIVLARSPLPCYRPRPNTNAAAFTAMSSSPAARR